MSSTQETGRGPLSFVSCWFFTRWLVWGCLTREGAGLLPTLRCDWWFAVVVDGLIEAALLLVGWKVHPSLTCPGVPRTFSCLPPHPTSRPLPTASPPLHNTFPMIVKGTQTLCFHLAKYLQFFKKKLAYHTEVVACFLVNSGETLTNYSLSTKTT